MPEQVLEQNMAYRDLHAGTARGNPGCFLRAETKAFRNRNVSGLDPNDRTLVIRVKVLTCRFLLLFARFGEPTEVFHTAGIVLLQEPLHVNFCAFLRV
ncbi:hypothetical protein Lpp71_13962 [Lacticaseibacillus paracasei subsp. paracasei Lpp71]|uniref:Uncharacterized protein n=1 Tax=Lacticaseibacillus paracasei subsp. paracasei Lpp71 TaxID=1256207 RepID=A0A8E0IPU4_LACPA|nr:hypothetical protein Lpp71_13962 [Lacticaseibacillus paracasei subsp. paracasei Lpp71]